MGRQVSREVLLTFLFHLSVVDWGSALIIILNGTKPQHLNMLEGGIIAKLLEEKWKTFAQMIFYKKIFFQIIHLLCISFAVYSRPPFDQPLMRGIQADTEIKEQDIVRYCFEIGTLLSVFAFMVFQLGEELKNAGLTSFWKNLVTLSKILIILNYFKISQKSSPPKMLFVMANFLILSCIPLRFLLLQPGVE